jgi:farnesyl diphosphate synthase
MRARTYADELRSDALAPLSIFGERAARLTELADFICHRQF